MNGKLLTVVLLQLGLQGFLIKSTSCQDILLNLNTKKVVAVTSDKFLSLTLDPAVLLTGDVLTSSTELSTNMAKALAPGYVRLAGPRSNTYTFERSLFPQSGYEDPDFTFSEAHWVLVQQWAQRSGLEVVSSLAPQRIENEDQVTTWDPRNSLELISFSDHMGYNISWQLGYECQTRCDISGLDFGKDVARLRNMLAAFPRYSSSVIAGPDIVSFRGKQQQQYIQDYLNAAGNSLSVLTWHPDFAGITLDSDGVALQTDTLAADKDMLYKAMGRSVSKKPLWIAESKPEECKRQFLGALVWARRLGNAAKLGVQVIMRQPDASNMFQPTPDYWVSLLHKMLVGKEVLDAKLTTGNKSHVHFYCQCTKPSAKYDRGAITIFGMNLTPGKISVSLKGLKIKAVHKYILMPGFDTENRMFAETVLLNNEPLNLLNGKNLPEINPAVSLMGKNMAVKLPSGGIGFWVIPGARVKSCLGHDEEGDKSLLLKKLAKKLEDQEITDENTGREFEEDNNQDSDAESAEDVKSLLKAKRKKGKYNRHSDDAEEEDRRFKRIDAKREFEKLEKLLKRNSNNEDKKSSHVKGRLGLSMFDSGANDSGENKDRRNTSEEEEAGIVRFKKNGTPDSGEEIRTKLEEYKNKLLEYETRKRNAEKTGRQQLEKTPKFPALMSSQNPGENLSNDVDTQKAVEALALISRVEGAIRDYEKSSERIKYDEVKPADLGSDIGEDVMIQELEKPDKIKRMIDPKSLGKLYHFLVGGDQEKRRKRSVKATEDKVRGKRDLEKLLGDDPLGLRKEGLFKKRLKNDEARERRLERRNRKKDKEDIGLKKEHLIVRHDPKITDSNENNFFGFPQMKPVENFPQGDLFLEEGTSSEDKNEDYVYVKDDDEDEAEVKQKSKRRRTKSKKQSKPVQDETWVEESNSNLNYAPNEFFERLNLPSVAIKSQWKDYGELYEPESLQAKSLKEEQKPVENETVVDTVIVRDRPDEREDIRAKETAVKKLINYYDNSEVLRNEPYELKSEKREPRVKNIGQKSRPETPTQRNVKEGRKTKPEEIVREETMRKYLELDDDYEASEDPGSMEFVNSKAGEDYSDELYDEDEIGAKKRPKRKSRNLDYEIFGPEMIREDAGNLRDCKCRVIRDSGKLKCTDCKVIRGKRDVAMEIPSSDFTQDPTIDRHLISKESANEEVLPNETEASAALEVTSSNNAVYDGQSMQTNTETVDLNKDPEESPVSGLNTDDKTGENSSSEVKNENISPVASSGPSTNGADSGITDLNESDKAESNFHQELEAESSHTGGEIETEKSSDDVVGSKQLNIDEEKEDPRNRDPEVPIVDEETNLQSTKTEEKNEKTVDIEENINKEEIRDENHSKRHISVNSDANSDAQSSTKFSLNKGLNLGSSAKTDFTGSKLKSGFDLKLKSDAKSGLKSDAAKNKLSLNAENLSAIIKENEMKKAEVIKALESSAKLKSVDNTKYLEYQKKRAEKLATLKDKLKERKAKILQQYRQELLDALSKCDTEVERNLKRREIFDNLTNREEFQDFVDKDKLAYLMMNRPVDYQYDEDRDHGRETDEARRYYPEIELVQPLRNPRERKIPDKETRRYFYSPRRTEFSFSSDESSLDRSHSSLENVGKASKDPYNDDESYYALVESLDDPKIFSKQHFHDMQYASGTEFDEQPSVELDELQFDDGKYQQQKKHHGIEQRYHESDFGRVRNNAEKPVHRVYAIEGSNYKGRDPVLQVYDIGREDSREFLIPEYQDGILHHKNYRQPIYPENRQTSSRGNDNLMKSHNPEGLATPKRFALDTGMSGNQEEYYGNNIAEIPLNNGLKMLQTFEPPCSGANCRGQKSFGNTPELQESYGYYGEPREYQRTLNRDEGFVGSGRLVYHENQTPAATGYRTFPLDQRGDSSVRRQRDVKEERSNYICVKEDSEEDLGEDEKRLFKLVRNDDHYEAVPISKLPEEPGAGKERKIYRRLAKQNDKVRNKKRRYDTDVFTDEDGNYYLKNDRYHSRGSPKKYNSENNEDNYPINHKNELGGKPDPIDDESDPELSQDEYEVLMLIPVKKHKARRQRRELEDNNIDRSESYEDMNNVWDDIVDIKENENRLQEYIEAKEKTLRDFQEAQSNLSSYLKKLKSMQDPTQINKFERFVLNLGSPDQEEMVAIAKSQDEVDRIHLGEYLKKEIIQTVRDEAEEDPEDSTTLSPETSTSTTLFDATMPKLENTINEELEKFGSLSESLEDFINEFDQKFNTTLEIKGNETSTEDPKRKEKISYNVFHNALNNVRKFFDFITGVSLIFRRH